MIKNNFIFKILMEILLKYKKNLRLDMIDNFFRTYLLN